MKSFLKYGLIIVLLGAVFVSFGKYRNSSSLSIPERILSNSDFTVRLTPVRLNREHDTFECILRVQSNPTSSLIYKKSGKLLCNLIILLYSQNETQPQEGFVFDNVVLETDKELFKVFWIDRKKYYFLNRQDFDIVLPKEYDSFNLKFCANFKELVKKREVVEKKRRDEKIKEAQASTIQTMGLRRMFKTFNDK
ncbi:MAG: hypothetical protein ABH865_03920 [Candidatus Omnitrophota bacterium]